MRNRCRLSVVLVLVLVAASCGDDDGPTTATTGGSEAAAFCESWDAALASGDDAAFTEALTDAPAELAEEARILRAAEASGEESPEAEAAASKVLDWIDRNCRRDDPGASTRRVAPPVDASFDGLTFCSATPPLPWPPSDDAGMVLYGDAAVSDPYDGPMLGLLWNPIDDGPHYGDGDSQPVTVRGQSGFAAPITVFQQVVLPELGTVIAWTEGDRAFGLYGRQWPIDRASELAEIAEGIEEASGGFRIADAALPEGYAEVFVGDPVFRSLVFPPSTLYSLHYEGDDGSLALHGLQMSEGEFDAFRFFTTGIEHGEVAGHDALVGSAWGDDLPTVVTWREPDGLVVRIVGIGVPLDTVEQVAERSRELSDDEWTDLVGAVDQCHGP